MRTKYIGKLTEAIKASPFDAVMVSPGEEMEFLTGFRPMMCERFQGMFFKEDGTMFYICNLLYEGELASVLPDTVKIYPWFDGEVMTEVVEKALREQGLIGKTIGVNSDAQGFNLLEIMDHVDVTFKNGKPLLEEMRIIKDSEELQGLREASALVDQVFTEVQSIIKPGIKEKEIADFLLSRMAQLGGASPECIVAIREHAGYPHYCGDQGVVGEHDIVLMDYGCTIKGMYADITRTVFVGEPTEKERECYELVKRSNEEAEAMVCEGAWIPDIDRRSREVLDEKGYAATLINRLGHGIGYLIHEAPDIKQSNPRKLEKGMAFSIEPGIYIPGELGIRIEDVVIVNEKGECEVLNKCTKEMIIL